MFTRNDSSFVQSIVKQLGTKNLSKDMGTLHYFMGMEVLLTFAGLFLSQHKYVLDLLSTTNMVGVKDVATPYLLVHLSN